MTTTIGDDSDMFLQFRRLLIGESDEPFTHCEISDATGFWVSPTYTATCDQLTLDGNGRRHFVFAAHGGATRNVTQVRLMTAGGFVGVLLDVSTQSATWAGSDAFVVEHILGAVAP